jgi:hypothetical protein
MREIGPIDLTRPRCMMSMNVVRAPSYPSISQVGSVVLFFRTDESGAIVSHQIAARAGAPEFAAAIERVIGTWRIEREPESPPNCRMAANFFRTVRFVMPN